MTPEAVTRDLVTAAITKEAGIIVYLQEELTDARLRCEQLKNFVSQAVRLISKSKFRDHFYEVAGDVMYGIPESLFKLDKALAATSLAASRLDYEELKSQLRPEKVQELEDVLRSVRLRQIDRRAPLLPPSQGKTSMYKAASQDRIATALRRIASEVERTSISPREASLRLSMVRMALSQTAQDAVQAMGPIQATTREDVIDGFKKANPALTEEQLEEIATQWEKNKDVVVDQHKTARYEEGVPADPTENMTEEDGEEWRANTEEYGDKFKTAGSDEENKVDNLVERLGEVAKEFKFSWSKYKSNPAKFKPQLDNLVSSNSSLRSTSRVLGTTVSKIQVGVLKGSSKTAGVAETRVKRLDELFSSVDETVTEIEGDWKKVKGKLDAKGSADTLGNIISASLSLERISKSLSVGLDNLGK